MHSEYLPGIPGKYFAGRWKIWIRKSYVSRFLDDYIKNHFTYPFCPWKEI